MRFLKCLILVTVLADSLSGRLQAQPDEAILQDALTAATVVVAAQRTDGTWCRGTGWVLNTQERTVVTAAHVLQSAARVFVTFPHKNRAGWVNTYEGLAKASPAVQAEVVLEKQTLDLAVLRVSTMPDTARMLKPAQATQEPGSLVYTVSHPVTASRLFHFERGRVEFQGFSATTAPVPGGEPVRLRADVFCYQSPGVDRGSSGCAIVNAAGEVVGWATMNSGLKDSDKVNCVGVSVRELNRALYNTASSKVASPRSLVGRWVGVMPNARAEIGIEFTADGKVAFLVQGGGKMAGTYQLAGNTLKVKINGKAETMQLDWTAGNTMSLSSQGFTAKCLRYDAGW